MDVPDEPFQDVNVSLMLTFWLTDRSLKLINELGIFFRLRRARNLLTTSFNCSLVALPSFSPSLRASSIPKPLMSTNLRKLIVFSGKT